MSASPGLSRRGWLTSGFAAAVWGGAGGTGGVVVGAALPFCVWALDAPAPPEVLAALPQARAAGHGRLRFMGLRVYDARLWVRAQDSAIAANGADALADWSALPLALEIRYLRELSGEQIAERSLAEMRRQGDLNADTGRRWLAQMKALFPDVKDGDRLTGVNQPGVGARFYLNGQRLGEVPEPDFARRFFGIWLSPRSSEPQLRAALLGQSRP